MVLFFALGRAASQVRTNVMSPPSDASVGTPMREPKPLVP